MDIKDLTVGQVMGILNRFGWEQQPTVGMEAKTAPETPFEVGKCYLIRTVTVYQVGRVAAIVGNFLVLEDASWVASTGRFAEAIDKGKLSEVEFLGGKQAIVNMGAIVDVVEWTNDLPDATK